MHRVLQDCVRRLGVHQIQDAVDHLVAAKVSSFGSFGEVSGTGYATPKLTCARKGRPKRCSEPSTKSASPQGRPVHVASRNRSLSAACG